MAHARPPVPVLSMRQHARAVKQKPPLTCAFAPRSVVSYPQPEPASLGSSPVAQKRGEDRPLKTNDDSMDVIRYGLWSRRIVWRHWASEQLAA